MHAALHDHLGVGRRRELGELQAVAHIVGDAMVDLGRLIIMREDDGAALFLELVDRLHVRRVERPFDGRHDPGDALIEMRRRRLDLGRPVQPGTRQHGKRGGEGGAGRSPALVVAEVRLMARPRQFLPRVEEKERT